MEAVDPAQERVAHDLRAPAFLDGVADGRWELVKNAWPYLTFAITAGDGRKFGIRVELSGYSASAPAGIPWNLVAKQPSTELELPMGIRADVVFRSGWPKANNWTPYMATERVLLTAGHPDWATLYPGRAWNSGRDLAFYLEQLHTELRTCTIPEPTNNSEPVR